MGNNSNIKVILKIHLCSTNHTTEQVLSNIKKEEIEEVINNISFYNGKLLRDKCYKIKEKDNLWTNLRFEYLIEINVHRMVKKRKNFFMSNFYKLVREKREEYAMNKIRNEVEKYFIKKFSDRVIDPYFSNLHDITSIKV